MAFRILLIAPAVAAEPVASELRRTLDAEVAVAPQRKVALQCLQQHEYTMVLLEESLTADDGVSTDAIYEAAGGMPVVEANFVIASTTRIVRQVRAALVRRSQDQAQARSAVAAAMRSELNGTLAGLLLESQLALRAASPEMEPKLRNVVALAAELREQLRA